MMNINKSNLLSKKNPKLAREWHPKKNGKLTPNDVTKGSKKIVWWMCKKGHEWEANINNRNNGKNCPYCAGRKICKDNCLKTVNPNLAKEWYQVRNGKITPNDVTANSNIKVWWKCNKGHIWKTKIINRNRGNNCPYCIGKKVCKDNCLKTINPNIAKEWHQTKNGKLMPKDVTANSGKYVWWKCNKGHIWKARIADRNRGSKCSYCAGRK